MENPEGVLILLDEFAKLKSKEIPNDLEEYLLYVAASGDPVYQWSLIKSLYRQKLINVITEFYEMCPVIDIPRCPNVDPFNYETMKNSLLKRLDSFSSAPFTIQRISELLTTPRKQYNRVDKFMRAIEKNIWVVSTREPGPREPANSQETSTNLVNGVTPRVCVTVKHPKRVKSIEERIKSGHPQLIDDDEDCVTVKHPKRVKSIEERIKSGHPQLMEDDEDEEEEEEEEMDEYEQMEEENNTEILPNNDADDTSLQCTSVKDLIEKYENGTIFSNTEEKTDFEEKSGQLEETAGEATPAPTPAPESEPESEPPSESEPDQEPESESVPPTADIPQIEEASTTPGDSIEEATPQTNYEEAEPKADSPVVAADSSSDLPVQESEVEGAVEGDVPTLDSTSDISVDDSLPVAEPSTTSSLEMADSEQESTQMTIDAPVEPSTSDISSDVTDGEFQSVPEPSSKAEFEVQTEEADTVNVSGENECI